MYDNIAQDVPEPTEDSYDVASKGDVAQMLEYAIDISPCKVRTVEDAMYAHVQTEPVEMSDDTLVFHDTVADEHAVHYAAAILDHVCDDVILESVGIVQTDDGERKECVLRIVQ